MLIAPVLLPVSGLRSYYDYLPARFLHGVHESIPAHPVLWQRHRATECATCMIRKNQGKTSPICFGAVSLSSDNNPCTNLLLRWCLRTRSPAHWPFLLSGYHTKTSLATYVYSLSIFLTSQPETAFRPRGATDKRRQNRPQKMLATTLRACSVATMNTYKHVSRQDTLNTPPKKNSKKITLFQEISRDTIPDFDTTVGTIVFACLLFFVLFCTMLLTINSRCGATIQHGHTPFCAAFANLDDNRRGGEIAHPVARHGVRLREPVNLCEQNKTKGGRLLASTP